MEATPGIEPGYADLQSAASPLRHVASKCMQAGDGRGFLEPVRALYFPCASRHLSYTETDAQARARAAVIISYWSEGVACSCGAIFRDWGRRLEDLARCAKRDGIALYLAVRHPGVSLWVKGVAVLVAAYVLSPIDLIPDFIPVIGFLDELILLPLVVGLLVRWVDPGVMAELRDEASRLAERPRSVLGAAIVVAVWIGLALLILYWVWPIS